MSQAHYFLPLEFPGSVWTDEPDPELSWFVVVCNPRRERDAAIGLRRRDMASYLPMELHHATINGRRGVRCKPLFPRYLFCGFVPGEPKFYSLAGVDGIESIVRIDGHPAKIPTGQIMAIAEAEKAGAFDHTRKDEPVFVPGQQVEITKPFGTFIGTVLKAAPGERVTVLLAMMGRASRVQVEVSDVRAL